MTETDRIKNALVNVTTLATHSDYYNKDRDDKDIDLIESIVKKEIPRSPIRFDDWYDHDGSLVHDGWKCPNCGTTYEIDDDEYNYCPNCGQRLDWSEL